MEVSTKKRERVKRMLPDKCGQSVAMELLGMMC
jgi:hypothetical protein